VSLDDFVNAESRQRLSLPRHEQGGGLISTHIGCELLQQISGFRPERTTSPFVALPVKAHAQWPIEINIFDSQVGHFLRSRAGVVKHHEESPIAQRKHAVAWQAPEEGFDFVVFQEQCVGRRGAFDRNCLHLLGFSEHLGMPESEKSVEGMQGG
jgi:hypothetical protein